METQLCEKLEDYFDECLSSKDSAAFERHLASCSNCKSELERLSKLQSLICDAWSDVGLPAILERKTKLSLNATDNSKSRKFVFNWAACIGLAGAILLTLFLTHRTTSNQPKSVASNQSQVEQIQPVAFFETKNEGTLLSPASSTADFTIVHAFPVSISTITKSESVQ